MALLARILRARSSSRRASGRCRDPPWGGGQGSPREPVRSRAMGSTRQWETYRRRPSRSTLAALAARLGDAAVQFAAARPELDDFFHLETLLEEHLPRIHARPAAGGGSRRRSSGPDQSTRVSRRLNLCAVCRDSVQCDRPQPSVRDSVKRPDCCLRCSVDDFFELIRGELNVRKAVHGRPDHGEGRRRPGLAPAETPRGTARRLDLIVFSAMEPFRFGWPEAKAVALAVAIIGTWAVIRYGSSLTRARPTDVDSDPA